MTMKMEGTLVPTDTTAAPGDDFHEDVTEVYQIIVITLVVINSLIALFGVIGNGLVIWVIGFMMKKNVNTVWFLNLSAADFLFLLFLPFRVTEQALDSHWPFGTVMCKLTFVSMRLNLFASVFTLTVISVDRFVSVIWPVWSQNQRNVQKAYCASVCVWLLALAFSLPLILNLGTIEFKNKTLCMLNHDILPEEKMTFVYVTFGFVIPLSMIVFCYAVMIHHLKKNPSFARKLSGPIKKIAVIIIAFFLCWAPYYILLVTWSVLELTAQYSKEIHHILFHLFPIAEGFTFLNSFLNPLLYVFLSPNFRSKARGSILNVLKAAFTE